MLKIPVFIIALIIIFSFNANAQLAIIDTKTTEELVKNFLSGESVEVRNIKFTGAPNSIGWFNSVATNLGLKSGIILTTGDVHTARGENNDLKATTINDTEGDADLSTLVKVKTYDAAVLEFDFSVQSDSVEFRYVFASEEYNHAVNFPFNDVFAFFISGPGIKGKKNIALIPNSSVPIAINNVNNGSWKGQSYGPCKNCEYYIDNTYGKNIQYNGFTRVLTAVAPVQPCQTYHIKLAITDAADKKYDSAIFLEAGSFRSSGKVSVIASGPTNICEGGEVTLTAAAASNYHWSTGEKTRSIKVKETGSYSLQVRSANCVASSDTIKIAVDKKPEIPVVKKEEKNLIVDNSNSDFEYTWFKSGDPDVLGKGKQIAYAGAGCYLVQVLTKGGCLVRSEKLCVEVENPNQIKLEDFFISADPMPGDVEFGIRFTENSDKPYRLRLYDAQQKLIYDETKANHEGIQLLQASGGKFYIKIGQ